MVPEISVVLPVYNAADFIEDCLRMLFAQSFRDFEVIAVDDGSTDASLDILQSHAAREPRLTVIHEENSGPGVARDTGMAASNGTYIIFLDPDDHFSPKMFEKLDAAAHRYDADTVICRSARVTFDEPDKVKPAQWTLADDVLPTNRPLTPGDVKSHLFQYLLGWPWDKLFRRDFIERYGLSYPDLRNSEDGVMVFPALCLSRPTVVIGDTLVYHMTGRDGSVSNSRSRAPLSLFEAESMIADSLKSHDVYAPFERSFVSWSVNYSLWHLDTLTPDAQKVAFDYIKSEFIPEYRAYLDDDGFIYDRFDVLKMRAIERYGFEDYLFYRGCAKAYEKEIELIGTSIRSSKTYRLGDMLARGPRAVMHLIKPDYGRRGDADDAAHPRHDG